MTRLAVDIKEELLEKFRKKAIEKFGYKGYMKQALEEAMNLWLGKPIEVPKAEVPSEFGEHLTKIVSKLEDLEKKVSELEREVSSKIDGLEGKVSAVHEILMKATKKKQDKVETKQEVKPKPEAKGLKEEIREAFLGKREPVTLADGKIVVSKGQIFVKADIGDYVNLDEYKVNVMDVMAETFAEEEFAEEEEGSVLVPDIGFDEDMSPEDWYDEYGEKLIKELLRVL